MSPVEHVLRVVGLPVRAGRARPSAAGAIEYVRSAPLSFTYLAILCVTTAVVVSSSPQTAHKLLLNRSTNLHQLSRDPVRVLAASAFWVEGVGALLVAAVLIVGVLAQVERRVGSMRTLAVFAVGHVGATLLTVGGLWVGIHSGLVEHRLAYERDVGASYGCLAVAGALTYLLPRRFRVPYATALVVLLLVAIALFDDFTSVGHVLAVLLGLACYGLVGRPELDG